MDRKIFSSYGDFLSIKSAETTPYFYAERKGIDSVAFILVDRSKEKPYGVVNERKPPLDERSDGLAFLETAFGGSNDIIDLESYYQLNENEKISHLLEIVKNEVREEAGYLIETHDITFISKEFVSTQMNQWCYLFSVNVSGIVQGEKDPQNETEAMATVVWKSLDEVKKMNDWKTKTIVFHLTSD